MRKIRGLPEAQKESERFRASFRFSMAGQQDVQSPVGERFADSTPRDRRETRMQPESASASFGRNRRSMI